MKAFSQLVIKILSNVNIKRIIKWLSRSPLIRRAISKYVIEGFANATSPRPRPFSMVADYTSWISLTDRSYTGRHLPIPDHSEEPKHPPEGEILKLFMREGNGTPATDTSVMFAFFAQWFTDSFLRTSWQDNRKNTSNHEIDLCQIYGLSQEKTEFLRANSGGALKSQLLKDKQGREAEYPPFLFELKDGSLRVKDEFKGLHDQQVIDIVFSDVNDDRKQNVFAVGLGHGNSSIGNSILNTLFLREHNRIAKLLAKEYTNWTNDRLFETTRNIMIVILLKLVVEEYISHIGPFDFPLENPPFIADGKRWNRANWIAIEFNLLYRWHSLVPNIVSDGNNSLNENDFRNNNPLIISEGIDSVFALLSQSKAGKIGLFNTANFLAAPRSDGHLSVEQRAIGLMRSANLAGYNAYRRAFGLRPLASFEELTKDQKVIDSLRKLYGTIDKLEWYVGIYAEGYEDYLMMGELMTTMVAYDAFTQALTNPLLARNVFNEKTFTRFGIDLIRETTSLQDIVHRNCIGKPRVSFRVE